MYEHNANQMILPYELFFPFEGHLNPYNRWVRMASVIPWVDLEEAITKNPYMQYFIGPLEESCSVVSNYIP
ncbi:hypothetical protein SporoP8_10920 [Sporosarcina ureae]|uniref:hypothetical protein n=1 Tax=Sporosarcina ureae TaxID=1571 RepID=UPI000A15A709|nr:hypothetical protein [Sporosarcina ureae]ARJ39339.1 hypothetical protein SporoP8_10920 [Sporosarcina ureae]